MRRILVKLLALGLALGTAFSSGAKTQEPEAPPMLATDPQAVKMLRRATSNGLETTTSFVQSQVAAPQQAQAPAPPAGAVSGNVDANGALQDTGEQLPGGGCPPGAPGGGACPGGSGAPATPTPAAGNTAAAPAGGRASPAAAGGAAAAANASPGKDGATGQTATEAVDAAGGGNARTEEVPHVYLVVLLSGLSLLALAVVFMLNSHEVDAVVMDNEADGDSEQIPRQRESLLW
eukprot:CAMPEP_0178998844 /NCGR_PEP_ID=MMETSP0795-20121207/9726_1 /TAXON_ID=88552 /ORGANISM="Amoebophrya sp., Strain Ameob2" /LENGTH=233 /DNA_ID=CAMNT_0020691543 /DNA_START=75 /DNA_END=776 /DNA_ORIENTATION=+